MKPRYTEQQWAAVAAMARGGHTQHEISDRTGISQPAIHFYMKAHNIPTQPAGRKRSFDYAEALRRREAGEKTKAIAREFGVSEGAIRIALRIAREERDGG